MSFNACTPRFLQAPAPCQPDAERQPLYSAGLQLREKNRVGIQVGFEVPTLTQLATTFTSATCTDMQPEL